MKNIFAKNSEKMPFSPKIWPKSPKKVGKFGSAIQNYWKIEKSAIRNRIHFIKSILVLVTWKNPLNRDFPLFAIKLYRESTVFQFFANTRKFLGIILCSRNCFMYWKEKKNSEFSPTDLDFFLPQNQTLLLKKIISNLKIIVCNSIFSKKYEVFEYL